MDKVMNQTYSSLADRQELELDTSLVKTYLLESHLAEDSSPKETRKALEALANKAFSTHRSLEFDATRDSELFLARTSVNKEPLVLYFDVSNPRFWLIHSANRSTNLDWLIDRLVKENERVDRSWLWPELLETLASKGSFRGLGLDYDRRIVPDTDFEGPDSVEYLKLQLWGTQAARVLDVLRHEFPGATTLSKVKLKYWYSQQPNGDFSVDDVKYDGKITARGTSFLSHLALVSSLHRDYAQTIRLLESTYSLQWNLEQPAVTIGGEALSFEFPDPIQDLGAFCEHVFSSALPFRLWGVPQSLSGKLTRICAIDLHSSSRIDVDLTPTFMRIYIPSGACANTILRLYTNLKHHYHSRISAKNGDGDIVL